MEKDYAHGRAYKFCSPDGPSSKSAVGSEYFKAPPELASKLRNRPSKNRCAVCLSGASIMST